MKICEHYAKCKKCQQQINKIIDKIDAIIDEPTANWPRELIQITKELKRGGYDAG